MPSLPAPARYAVRATRRTALNHFSSAHAADLRARRRVIAARIGAGATFLLAIAAAAWLWHGIPSAFDLRVAVIPISLLWLVPPILLAISGAVFSLSRVRRLDLDSTKLIFAIELLTHIAALTRDDDKLHLRIDFRDPSVTEIARDWLALDGAFAAGGRFALRIVQAQKQAPGGRSPQKQAQNQQQDGHGNHEHRANIFLEVRPEPHGTPVAVVATRLNKVKLPPALKLEGVATGPRTARTVISAPSVNAKMVAAALTLATRAMAVVEANRMDEARPNGTR